MGQERRRHIRTPGSLMAIVKNMKTGKVKRWLTKNISGTGLCLIGAEAAERGSRFEIELKLPDFPTPFTMMAEVVWIMTLAAAPSSKREPKVELGVRFTDLTPKTQGMLNQYALMTAPPPNL